MTTKRWILFSVFLLLAAILVAAVLTPDVRARVQALLFKPEREILATAEGDVLNDGTAVKVLKIRDSQGIFVEVLRMAADGSSSLVDRVVLPDKHDGLFNFQGHVTRLAIADVDQDGRMEVLAPTFDRQLVPHLNVFRYNPQSNRFEAFEPPKE
ncbi:MAG: hypothetical protein AB7G93_02735 [Bdellovibrionales bacterium]